ncbi:MAG: tRNA (N(6)-L-threonylcarbamoyladenosine(37)-C(2))-methylthiotransferase MtaB [Leptospiraceae bacterium]|nr:tRNA (N(6)-L-threonylcarbamoyladenosine(37)-C(2))-methylthiotransferase MtaB [Leptospiraceae bacterium]MCP5501403.1 tRNA (N(6)-L-threonylcarbamoyladenosine(37)-C(2))-methylthiotransferase MtaB [Leptospiraceae bacterium]
MNKPSTVGFYTLGCRLNIFESDGLSAGFEKLGVKSIDINENPDIIVINTCTVTNKADGKNRNIIRNAIKKHPGSKVYVTGCYAQTDREIIQNIPGVSGVIDNDNKSSLPQIILGKPIELNQDRFAYADTLPLHHTRAYLKIQDGCNRSCSYCKIPGARGKGQSRNFSDVLDQIRFLQDNGIGEIILTGVNLGWYRDKEGMKSFNKLLRNILNLLEYSRLRLSSIEPSDVGLEFIETIQHPRFCRYLHVPLQSGSSYILKKMKRSYNRETFIKRISLVKNKIPDIFLGTDVITGFPGETELEFEETLQVCNDLGFSKIHAFPYSARRGTLAASYPETLKREEKKERVKQLNNLSERQYVQYGKRFTNQTLECILEGDGTFLSDNYIRIRIENESILDKLKVGQFVNIRLLNYDENTDKKVSFPGELQRGNLSR